MDNKCKDCGGELRVVGSRYTVKNDDTPDATTRLFVALTMECVDPQCSAYGKKHDVPIEQNVETAKNTRE